MYQYKATTSLQNKVESITGQFIVRDLALETLNLTADYGMLRALSQQTGGQFVKSDQIEQLKDYLLKNKAPDRLDSAEDLSELIQQQVVVFLVIVVSNSRMGSTKVPRKLLTIIMPQIRRQLVILVLCIFTLGREEAFAQKDTLATRPNYRALRWIMAGESAAYVGSIYGLSKAWYKTNDFSHCHVSDDAHEWQQLDKVGHFFTAYQICRHTAALYQQTNVSRKQAALYGALSGFLFLTPIEILDGFQYPTYGFSPSDMVANVLGGK